MSTIQLLTKRKNHGPTSGLGTGAIIALGASVGGLVLIALLANLLCWRSRRARRAREAAGIFDPALEFPYANQHASKRSSTSPVMKDSKSLYETPSNEDPEAVPSAYVPTQDYASRPPHPRSNTGRTSGTRGSSRGGPKVSSPPTSPRKDKFGPAPIGAPVGDGAQPWVANTVETLYARPTTPGLYRATSPEPGRRAASPSSGRATSPLPRGARATSPLPRGSGAGRRPLSPNGTGGAHPTSPLSAEFPASRSRSPPTHIIGRPPKAAQRVPRKKTDSLIDGVEMVDGVPISFPSAPQPAHVRQASS